VKTLTIVLVALAAVGCVPSYNPAQMQERQWGGEKVFTDLDLARIEQLRPQLPSPFRLAIAPPMVNDYGQPAETEGEHEALLAFAAELRKAGVVSDAIVLPRLLVDATARRDGYFQAVRGAAARVQADAVLLMSSVTDVSSYANPLAILDVTLVGMMVVPGHHKGALTILEGVVMDNRNEYVYWTGSVRGHGSAMGTLAHVNEDTAIQEARVEALRRFGERLAGDAPTAFRPLPSGGRYATPGR
jgi:hypothetical protein